MHDTAMLEVLGKVLDIIDRAGYAVQAVGNDYAYTIGLAARGHPELVIFGLPWNVGYEILNELGKRIVAGETFEAGRHTDILADDVPVQLIPVTDSSEHLGIANWYHREEAPVPALQLVWPDIDGRFPWEPDCRVQLPLLGAAP